MYEGAAGQSNLQSNRNPTPIEKAPEPVSEIHSETRKLLYEINNALEGLLNKTLGPRPQETANNSAIAEQPSMVSDARGMRNQAREAFDRVQALHNFIGYH